jgi:hypothetical protein
MAVAAVEAVKGQRELANEVVADEIVVEDEESEQCDFGDSDQKLETLVEGGISGRIAHSARTLLGTIGGDSEHLDDDERIRGIAFCLKSDLSV